MLTLRFKIDPKDSGSEDVACIHSVKDAVQSKTLVNKIKKPSGSMKCMNFNTSRTVSTFLIT